MLEIPQPLQRKVRFCDFITRETLISSEIGDYLFNKRVFDTADEDAPKIELVLVYLGVLVCDL